MNVKQGLSGFGSVLMIVIFAALGIGVGTAFIFGAAWASEQLLPLFSFLTWLGLAAVVFILLPMAIPRATRDFSSGALRIASYVFGATLWMEGLLLTLSLVGGIAVFVGIFMAGIGVVPIAILATILNGMWGHAAELLVLVIMTFASRAGAASLAVSLQE